MILGFVFLSGALFGAIAMVHFAHRGVLEYRRRWLEAVRILELQEEASEPHV